MTMKLPEMDKLIIDVADGHPGAAGVAGKMLQEHYDDVLQQAIEDNITGESLWFVYAEMARRDIDFCAGLIQTGYAQRRLLDEKWSNVYRSANNHETD